MQAFLVIFGHTFSKGCIARILLPGTIDRFKSIKVFFILSKLLGHEWNCILLLAYQQPNDCSKFTSYHFNKILLTLIHVVSKLSNSIIYLVHDPLKSCRDRKLTFRLVSFLFGQYSMLRVLDYHKDGSNSTYSVKGAFWFSTLSISRASSCSAMEV